MKHIKVDCCKPCPYFGDLLKNICRHPKAGNKPLHDINIIHEDYPLENLKEN